jgi:hypothetical protein
MAQEVLCSALPSLEGPGGHLCLYLWLALSELDWLPEKELKPQF